MRRVAVTGASGLVATEFMHLLLSKGDEVVAVTENPGLVEERYRSEGRVRVVRLSDLGEDGGSMDVVVHCAFARSASGASIASSLRYTKLLLETLSSLGVSLFVNISSQSVYGKSRPPFWREDDPVDPDYLYAMGKYACELMVAQALSGTPVRFTSIRLCSVSENARFLNVFARNALAGEPIRVQGGTQRCSFIDVRDVAEALLRVIEGGDIGLREVYNLGRGDNVGVLELARIVEERARRLYGAETAIEVVPSSDSFAIGMDSSLFERDFGWKAERGYEDMVDSLLALNARAKDDRGAIPWSFRMLYM